VKSSPLPVGVPWLVQLDQLYTAFPSVNVSWLEANSTKPSSLVQCSQIQQRGHMYTTFPFSECSLDSTMSLNITEQFPEVQSHPFH
jgi:hypothetical protein